MFLENMDVLPSAEWPNHVIILLGEEMCVWWGSAHQDSVSPFHVSDCTPGLQSTKVHKPWLSKLV